MPTACLPHTRGPPESPCEEEDPALTTTSLLYIEVLSIYLAELGGPTWQNPVAVLYPPAQMTSLGSSKRPYSRHSFLQYSILTTGTSTICSTSACSPCFVNPHPATRHFALFLDLNALLEIGMGWILWSFWDFCSCSCRYRCRTPQYENGYVSMFNQTW